MKIEQGVLAMARGDDYNSAYGQFFIATKDATELSEDYCGFGKITNYEIIEAILADVGGEITGENAPKIKSITYHEHH